MRTINSANCNHSLTMSTDKAFTCDFCNKEYKHRQGLWKHKKICGQIKKNEVKNEPSDKDLIMMLIKENSDFKNMVMKVLENVTINHSHNTTTISK